MLGDFCLPRTMTLRNAIIYRNTRGMRDVWMGFLVFTFFCRDSGGFALCAFAFRAEHEPQVVTNSRDPSRYRSTCMLYLHVGSLL